MQKAKMNKASIWLTVIKTSDSKHLEGALPRRVNTISRPSQLGPLRGRSLRWPYRQPISTFSQQASESRSRMSKSIGLKTTVRVTRRLTLAIPARKLKQTSFRKKRFNSCGHTLIISRSKDKMSQGRFKLLFSSHSNRLSMSDRKS